jgi:hypothetical protein
LKFESFATLVARYESLAGPWRAKHEELFTYEWQSVDEAARLEVLHFLMSHPDPALRTQAARAAGQWNRSEALLVLIADPNDGVRKYALYTLKHTAPSLKVAARLWSELVEMTPGTQWNETLTSYVHHATSHEVQERLVEIGCNHASPESRTLAVHLLTSLGHRAALEGLLDQLEHEPKVNWSLHCALLSACRSFKLKPPWLPALESIDDLHLAAEVAKW